MDAIGPRHTLVKLIRTALDEDIGAGDVTTVAALRGDETGLARATAKAGMVVAGIESVRGGLSHPGSDSDLSSPAA